MQYKVDDVNFVSYKYYNNSFLDKEFVYVTYYINTFDSDSRLTLQQYCKANAESLQTLNEEEVEKSIDDKLASISSVSKLAKVSSFIDDIRESVKDSTLKQRIPSFTVSTYPMDGVNHSKLDCIIIWELSYIFAPLNGYFFENLLSYIIGCPPNVNDFSKLLMGKNAKITHKQFFDTCERRGMITKVKESDEYKCEWCNEKINFEGITYIPTSFTMYVLFSALVAYLEKNDFTNDDSDKLTAYINYMNTNKTAIDTYITNLKESTIVDIMKREKHLEHSKSISNDDLNGEVDFISTSYITDIKCYKNNEFKLWFAQLRMYRDIVKNKSLKLRIINFNSDEFYEFNDVC